MFGPSCRRCAILRRTHCRQYPFQYLYQHLIWQSVTFAGVATGVAGSIVGHASLAAVAAVGLAALGGLSLTVADLACLRYDRVPLSLRLGDCQPIVAVAGVAAGIAGFIVSPAFLVAVAAVGLASGYEHTVKKFLDICPAISGRFRIIQLFLDICPVDNNPAISGYLSEILTNIQK